MQIEEYISSGILELYVVGATTEEENREIEQMAQSNELIRNELRKIEGSIENFAQLGAVSPPLDIKQKIWENLKNDSTKSVKIFQINSIRFYAIAASVVLLISVGFNFVLFSNLKETEEKLAIAQTENFRIAEEVKINQLNYTYAQKEIDLLRNPNGEVADLISTSPEFVANAYVYWDKKNKEVFINVQKLPVPEGNKQYQLWALVDGKPVDAGVFEVGLKGLQKMNKIENAQAFAVTLEKFGGSTTPTSEILVIGNI